MSNILNAFTLCGNLNNTRANKNVSRKSISKFLTYFKLAWIMSRVLLFYNELVWCICYVNIIQRLHTGHWCEMSVFVLQTALELYHGPGNNEHSTIRVHKVRFFKNRSVDTKSLKNTFPCYLFVKFVSFLGDILLVMLNLPM